MNLKERIMAAQDRPLVAVEVPEWGATVYLRSLTAKERDEIVEMATRTTGPAGDRILSVTLVGRCMCDEHGSRVFGDSDLTSLADKSGAVVDRLFGEALSINGIGKASQQAIMGNSNAP